MATLLIDSHCHIQSAGSQDDSANGERVTLERWEKVPERTPDSIIAEAIRHGVTRMVCVGCDLADSRLAVEFVQSRPECWASIGLHPHEARHYAQDDNALAQFAELAGRHKVVAVGECGLDYYYGHSPKTDQADVLRFQMELAQKRNLPMIFHVRGSLDEPGKDAFGDFWHIFDTMSSSGNIRGVLHSFTDSQDNMERALERGLYIGVNGIATFTRDAAQLDMYKQIPLSRLLLETDAPFLTPSPFRGKICEPYHARVVAEFMAGLRGTELEELAAATTSNAIELFGIR